MITKKHMLTALSLIASTLAFGKIVKNVPFEYTVNSALDDSSQPDALKVELTRFTEKDKDGTKIEPFSFTLGRNDRGGNPRNAQLYSFDGTKFIPNYKDSHPRHALKIVDAHTGKLLFESFPNIRQQGIIIHFYDKTINGAIQNPAGAELSDPSEIIRFMQEKNETNLGLGNKITFRAINADEAKAKYGSAAFQGGPWLKLYYPFEVKVTVPASGKEYVYLVEENAGQVINTVVRTK